MPLGGIGGKKGDDLAKGKIVRMWPKSQLEMAKDGSGARSVDWGYRPVD